MEITWTEAGKDEITITLEMDKDSIQKATFSCSGSLAFTEFSKTMVAQLKGDIGQLELPSGTSPETIIWKEIFMKIKGQWEYPIKHEEVCHCRRVLATTIDSAIIYGAHNLDEVRKRTSANTGCGTCLPDIESLLKLRL